MCPISCRSGIRSQGGAEDSSPGPGAVVAVRSFPFLCVDTLLLMPRVPAADPLLPSTSFSAKGCRVSSFGLYLGQVILPPN